MKQAKAGMEDETGYHSFESLWHEAEELAKQYEQGLKDELRLYQETLLENKELKRQKAESDDVILEQAKELDDLKAYRQTVREMIKEHNQGIKLANPERAANAMLGIAKELDNIDKVLIKSAERIFGKEAVKI